MNLGKPGSEQHRTRVGLLFLAIGVVLVLWAWGSWVYRASAPVEAAGSPIQNVSAPSPDTVRAVQLSPLILLVGLLLLLLFLFGSHAMVRAARRYRELAARKRPPPTASDDVWAMNKLRHREDEDL